MVNKKCIKKVNALMHIFVCMTDNFFVFINTQFMLVKKKPIFILLFFHEL